MGLAEFGDPVPHLPMASRSKYEIFWEEVGDHVRARPGQWIPVLNPPVSISRIGNIGTLLRNRTDDERIPVGVRDMGFKVRVRANTCYVRYDKP